jgi:hypothetical protein
MAWTKTKIGIVVGVVALLAVGTAFVTVKAVNAAMNRATLARIQGDWEGTLTANQTQLRLVLKIFKTNNTYSAVIDSVDQGVKNIPVARISARRNSFHAELPALHADYQAALNAGGTEITGKWKQGNRSFRLKLRKTTQPDRVAEAMTTDEFAPRPGSALQGAWEGTLKVGNVELRLALRISEPTPGTFEAQMDSVDQGAKNLPVTSLSYNKPAVQFEMIAINGAFEGTVNDQDDQIAGTWTQMGRKLPLTFQRAATNAQAAAGAELDYGHGAADQVQGHWKGAHHVASRVPRRTPVGWFVCRDHGQSRSRGCRHPGDDGGIYLSQHPPGVEGHWRGFHWKTGKWPNLRHLEPGQSGLAIETGARRGAMIVLFQLRISSARSGHTRCPTQ